MNKLEIDGDLVSLLSWVIIQTALGTGSSVVCNRTATFDSGGMSVVGSSHWLEHVYDQLKPAEIGAYLVGTAFEFLTHNERMSLYDFCGEQMELEPEMKQSLKRRGFLNRDGSVPRLIQEHSNTWWRFVNNGID